MTKAEIAGKTMQADVGKTADLALADECDCLASLNHPRSVIAAEFRIAADKLRARWTRNADGR